MLNFQSKTLDELATRIGQAVAASPAKDIEKNVKAIPLGRFGDALLADDESAVGDAVMDAVGMHLAEESARLTLRTDAVFPGGDQVEGGQAHAAAALLAGQDDGLVS